MIVIDESTDRPTLEVAAVEAGFADTTEGCEAVIAMTDAELRDAIRAWIEAGDECAGA